MVTNGYTENGRMPSETIQNSQDTNTSTSQDSNGSIPMESAFKFSAAIDVSMPVDEQDSSSEDSSSGSRNSPMKIESSPQQIDSPSIDAESTELTSGVLHTEGDPNVYDVEGNIGAMGDGFYAHLLNSNESRESVDQAYYNRKCYLQDFLLQE